MAKPQPNYPSRFLERESAKDYTQREYSLDSYATLVWNRQSHLVNRLLLEMQERAPAGHHLDFACGAGRITSLTEKIFSKVDALDISPAMVELARASCPRTEFYVGNILENPELCRGPYSSITAFRLLLNLDPPLRRPILEALARRLKPGGTLLINLHGNRYSLRQPAILWKRWKQRRGMEPEATMLNDMSLGQTRSCLETAGFSVEEVYGTGILPPTVFRWPLRRMWNKIDDHLSALGFLKSIGIDLLFVCRKKDSSSP